MKSTCSLFALIACFNGMLAIPAGATPPSVPSQYTDLYSTLHQDLNAFNTTLNGLWNGSTYPVVFAGNLANANGNTGPSLVGGGQFAGGQLEFQALKAMGVQGIMVQVGFPVLYEPFYNFLPSIPGFEGLTYSQFVNYYQQVAQNVHAAGLKLAYGTQAVPPLGPAAVSLQFAQSTVVQPFTTAVTVTS